LVLGHMIKTGVDFCYIKILTVVREPLGLL
jgi:hypothetical protein